MHTTACIVAAGAVLALSQAPAPSPLTQQVPMFAEARSAMAAEPAVLAPEYFAYLAHQEEAAGQPGLARGDRDIAFNRALALPDTDAALATKREIEPDVVAAAIAQGDFARAEQLAARADAAAAAIADALIPALLDAQRPAKAWATWSQYRPREGEFAFHAAIMLLQSRLDGQRQLAVRKAALAAARTPATMLAAEEAMDYFEADTKPERHDRAFAEALRYWYGALEALHGAAWNVTALEQRAAAVKKEIGVRDLSPVAPGTVAAGAPERMPPTPALPFNAGQSEAARRSIMQYSLNWPGQRTSLGDFPPELERQEPSYVLLLAYDRYIHNRLDEFHGLLTRSLRGTNAEAAQPRPDGKVNFNGVELWVYGRAAQMDFDTTRRYVEALPAGWIKPLALALVARMAGPAAANRPGTDHQVYQP